MFEIGDIVIYGSKGVCRVEEIGPIDLSELQKGKLYYTLSQYYAKESRIFTPVDNQKVLMRYVLNKEQAMEMIDEIKDIDILWVNDEKRREQEYKDAMHTCDCRELVKIIKTIYMRKESRMAEGKKITATDERYFKQAEDSLYGELAIPLAMSKEDTKRYVIEKVKESIARTELLAR